MITETVAILQACFSGANLQNFAQIVHSILILSRPVTMLSIARAGELSYRTIQRFYGLSEVPWLVLNLTLFQRFIYQADQLYLLVADETVEGKAGKQTAGIGSFYSSTVQKVIPGICFLVFSIIDVRSRWSYYLGCQQLPGKGKPEDKLPSTPKTPPQPKTKQSALHLKVKSAKAGPGRPKGSKNKPKTEPESASYQTFKSLLSLVCGQWAVFFPALQHLHLVVDGFYGHDAYLQVALEKKVYFISKFKSNAHLILPYQGEQAGLGRPKTRGGKLDYNQIPSQFYVQTRTTPQQRITTKVYQCQAYTPKIPGRLLNLVILVHTHTRTQKQSRTVLFASNLHLSAAQIIDYYSLRFQIEFDFRDAKQFFGLADFKNYRPKQVTNAANLAFTMTSLVKILLEKYKKALNCPQLSIWDLKTALKAQKQANIFFNSSQNSEVDFFKSQLFLNLVKLEAIHL
jgi:putative transposase